MQYSKPGCRNIDAPAALLQQYTLEILICVYQVPINTDRAHCYIQSILILTQSTICVDWQNQLKDLILFKSVGSAVDLEMVLLGLE